MKETNKKNSRLFIDGLFTKKALIRLSDLTIRSSTFRAEKNFFAMNKGEFSYVKKENMIIAIFGIFYQ